MRVFRIVHKSYVEAAPSGIAGRWNYAGRKVIYTAGSLSLAFLESMIRRQGVGFNDDFRMMVYEIPEKLSISEVMLKDLEKGWRDRRNYESCQPIGEKWILDSKTAVLKVPSAVIPEEYNFVINYLHTDFKKVRLVEVSELVPDSRIERLLKNNPSTT